MSEKVEQAHIVQLLARVAGSRDAVYVLGTRRGKGERDHGTHQTPGIPDVYAFLPPAPRLDAARFGRPEMVVSGARFRSWNVLRPGEPCTLWVEVKAEGGRLRPEQARFRERCGSGNQPHIVGGLDDVIAFLVAGGWLKADTVPHYRRPADPGPTTEVQP